jgi:hypothetical protein
MDTSRPHARNSARAIRVLLMLLTPLALLAALVNSSTVLGQKGDSPLVSPPSNLQLVALDSSFHVTWSPSADPTTAWHLVTVWDAGTLQQSKVVGKTARAAQTNGLVPGHSYTVKVQAMDAAGGLSTAISADATTDPQSPMSNAAFFENFNGYDSMAGLDPNIFDVRTSHFSDLQPVSIGVEKMMVFAMENHFHTQVIGGKGRGEIIIRPRVPFNFAGRMGTFQTEVDLAPVQRSSGKWFEFHLVRNLPWSGDEFGDGEGEDMDDSIEFSVRRGDDTESTVNYPQITVNIGGTVSSFRTETRQLTPANVRVPVVLKVSQTRVEFWINGVNVLNASGFNIPWTSGYWIVGHRNWYASQDRETTPMIVQLVHWETMQFDGPAGSLNPVTKMYTLQSGCPGIVHFVSGGVQGCPALYYYPGRDNYAFNFNIPENPAAQGRTARLLFNGSAPSTFTASINGNLLTLTPRLTDNWLRSLVSAEFPANWLRQGNNSVILTYDGDLDDGPGITQVEVEVVYNQPRSLPPPQHTAPMPMLGVTAQNFRFDHAAGDPTVHTATTNLYSLGWANSVPFTATVVSTETNWLTVSPASGVAQSPALGGGVIPLTVSADFSSLSTDSNGVVGVVKVTGGAMPLYLGVLAVNDGSNHHYNFIQTFNNPITTFDKNAIPDYHGGDCVATFSDVPVEHWAYQYVNYMVCGGIVSGYGDGTFRPNNPLTRGQLAKIVANAAGFAEPVSGQTYEDIPVDNTFYTFVERLTSRGIIGGYACGGAGEPCVPPGNRPYFRAGANASRGQISKIVSNAANFSDPPTGQVFEDVPPGSTFYDWVQRLASRNIMQGYACGGPGEPCGPGNLPYFRPASNATRAQTTKIVYNTFVGP